MPARARWTSLARGLLGVVIALVVAGCAEAPSPLDPRTQAASRIAELGWIMIVLATAICAIVFGALIVALRASPRGDVREPRQAAVDGQGLRTVDRFRETGGADRAVVLTGMVLPAAILVFTFGFTVYTLRQVAGVAGAGGASTFAAHGDHAASDTVSASLGILPAVTVNVTGHQWWWQVEYPDAQVVTANEIYVPAGVPIQLRLTSEDVIHSFWVPQVTGKVDLIPGKVNLLTLRPDQPGVYRGLCSEFCGLQHAHMHLRLVVVPAEEYVRWLDRERQAAAPPATAAALEGQRAFVARCGECHTVRGTSAGTSGPDLTHLASRRTLGAGSHENSRSNLAGWTTDAQTMKPGNRMPSIALGDEELPALLEYLEGLE
jgi:cytochrome c oxidase subunit 2